MRILLVATRPQDADAVETSLLADGHTVTACGDLDGGPCRGVHVLDDCPLSSSVDVAIVARSRGITPGLGEMGAICAARHRVGVVTVDPADVGSMSVYDLADDAERALCVQYAESVRRQIATMSAPEATTTGVVLDVEVTRRDTDVRVVVTTARPVEPLIGALLADRARTGVRDFDCYARVIDVHVTSAMRR